MSERWLHTPSLSRLLFRGESVYPPFAGEVDGWREWTEGWEDRWVGIAEYWAKKCSIVGVAPHRFGIDNSVYWIPRKTKGRTAIAQAPASSKPTAAFRHRTREGWMSLLRSWCRGDHQHSFHYRVALPFSRGFFHVNAINKRQFYSLQWQNINKMDFQIFPDIFSSNFPSSSE